MSVRYDSKTGGQCLHPAPLLTSDMNILIIHAYSPANLGDGAILLAMISEARRVFGEDVVVDVSATDPAAFEAVLGVKAHGRLLPWHSMGGRTARLGWLVQNLLSIVLLWWGSGDGRRRLARLTTTSLLPAGTRAAVAAYMRADLVLAAGGGYLGDSYRRQLPFWHLEYRCAGAAGVPLVFFTQSVGASRHIVTRVFLRKALRRCALFIARDRASVENLDALGSFTGKLALAPDVALLLGPPASDPLNQGRTDPCVGVSLMNWANFQGGRETGHRAYLAGMERALDALLVRHPGLRVRLYPTNAPVGANPMDDVAVVVEMRDRLSKRGFADRCVAVEWTPHPNDFMRDVSQCDLFIATRMHAAVLALNAGVPVAGVAYEEKMRGLLEMFELGEYVADIEVPDAIPDLVSRAYDRRVESQRIVARVGPDVRARASRAMDLAALHATTS
jgi:colanic acid/amylovoran biosynthesis protein